MAATNTYALTTSAYTAVGALAGRLRLIADRQGARLIVARSLPSADSNDWYPLAPNRELEMSAQDGATVYALTEPGASATASTIRVLGDAPNQTLVPYPLF